MIICLENEAQPKTLIINDGSPLRPRYTCDQPISSLFFKKNKITTKLKALKHSF